MFLMLLFSYLETNVYEESENNALQKMFLLCDGYFSNVELQPATRKGGDRAERPTFIQEKISCGKRAQATARSICCVLSEKHTTSQLRDRTRL